MASVYYRHIPLLFALFLMNFVLGIRIMVFNATFNNISVISWQLVLFVEKIGVPGKTTNMSQATDKLLSHNVVSSTPHLSGIRTQR